MIKIKISESLKASITQLVDSRLVESKDLVEELENSLTLGYLTSKQFEELTSVIKVKNQAPLCTSFHDIQIQVPTSISIDSDDVLQKRQETRREYLRLRQEERDYNKMIYGQENNPNLDQHLSLGSQFNSLKSQISIGFNMIFSMVATFGMGFYVCQQLGLQHNQSMMVALAAAIAVMILEMVLFIMRAVRIEDATEGTHSANAVRLAKMRSGSLVTDTKVANAKKNE